MTCDKNILAQVLYQDQSIVDLIGHVNCSNKKCRGEKCVYLTSFEEINKNTYEYKQCKACSHLLKIPFKDQKPHVTLFGWTHCFIKKTKLDDQKKKLPPLMRQYSLGYSLAAWSWLLSQRKEFLGNHLPRVPITPKQQGAFEVREVLSSVEAQHTDTRG